MIKKNSTSIVVQPLKLINSQSQGHAHNSYCQYSTPPPPPPPTHTDQPSLEHS